MARIPSNKTKTSRRESFAGTERFAIEAQIGSGGMGMVFRAFDRERRTHVALKLLRKINPLAIYRFKREFRTIADITHPNLVSLYELVAVDDDWFFTMELVDGRSFLDYVRGLRADMPASALTGDSSDPFNTPTTEIRAGALPPSAVQPLHSAAQFQRLRSGLRQLVQGVSALHDAGVLHRDIKPSNIMVAHDGRVVLLDFGIVKDTAYEHGGGDDDAIVGTPAYMAPEQAAGEPVSEASDWYSVGVVLFEAITGRRPSIKRPDGDAAALEASMLGLAPDAPPDLVKLCAQSLQRAPERRPGGETIGARLGGDRRSMDRIPRVGTGQTRALLIGRDRHLKQLDATFTAVRRGEQRTIYVHGGSGIGKTALVQYFLSGVSGTRRAVVLSGRCYERESVPYKGVDSMIDGLTRHLLTLAPREVRHLMPPNIHALARLFPVLNRVRGVRQAQKDAGTLDPYELRRRAFVAFRGLIANLCERTPVVMYIDDVQWGDSDSAALLADAIRPPSPPPFMLIASYRTADAATSPFLTRLLREAHNSSSLEVSGLSDVESRELAMMLLERGGGPAEFDIHGIAREAGGSPFFVGELVRYLTETGSVRSYTWVRRGVRLEDVLQDRVNDLPQAARRLLETVAVAGRPVPQTFASRVAAIGEEEQQALTLLRNRNLVRTRGPREDDDVEPYHDRIRETVVASMEPSVAQAYHRDLAMVLESEKFADKETIAHHYEACGEAERAGLLYEAAAGSAAEALAFDRAAALYRRAVELSPVSKSGSRLRSRLGDALASAGRGPEAADAFLEATKYATTSGALELRVRAAEQLLRSGHIDAGLEILEVVLSAVGMRLPKTPGRALIANLQWRLRLRMRGLDFTERAAADIPEADMRRVEVTWSAGSALALCEPMRGAYFQARHLLYALKSGERNHIARGLAIEACYASLQGFKTVERAEQLAARARELSSMSSDPLSVFWADAALGLIAFATERWQLARESLEAIMPMLYDHSLGTPYELHGCHLYRIFALFYLGEFKELGLRVPQLMREAEGRGNIYAATDLRSGFPNFAWLVADDPEGARAAADDARRGWRSKGFQLQHYWDLVARQHIRMYQGYGDEAWRGVLETWGPLSRSHLLSIHMVRLEALHLRARCALAAAEKTGDDLPIKHARRVARKLERTNTPCALAMGALIRAGERGVVGDQDGAAHALREAAARCEAAELWAYEAAANRRLGRLLGGEEGLSMTAVADDWFASQSVVDPVRITATLLPGFRDDG